MASAHAKQKANAMRKDIIEMIHEAGSGHPGGSLSCTDILAALYFGDVMTYDPAHPTSDARDRFILAKGHAAPALYAALAEAGFFPKDELKTLRKLGSRLQGHPDSKLLPGVEVSTGSLGQGLSVAAGLAAFASKEAIRRSIRSWAMANAKKARCGKQLISPQLKRLAILSQSSIPMDCRSMVVFAMCAPLASSMRNSLLSVGTCIMSMDTTSMLLSLFLPRCPAKQLENPRPSSQRR